MSANFSSNDVVTVAEMIAAGKEYAAGEKAKRVALENAHELLEAAGKVLVNKVYADNPGAVEVLVSRAKHAADKLDARTAQMIKELGF